MVIYSHKCGQLGNRLFAFTHLIANAAENNYRMVNLSFDEYAQYFETTSQDVFCRYPSTRSTVTSNRVRSILFQLNRAVVKAFRTSLLTKSFLHKIVVADLPEYNFHEGRYYHLNTAEFQRIVRTRKWTFLFGRFFRDYDSVVKHKNIIRKFFSPISSIEKNVKEFLAKARLDAEVVVGVHIRRGDYQQYAGGKYFYSINEYVEKIRELQSSEPKKKFAFVVCSNEILDTSQFKALPCFFGPGHLVEDLYIFAGCNFLMGPPSTYTRWASFYGNVPLFQLEDLTTPVRIQDFDMLPPEKLFDF